MRVLQINDDTLAEIKKVREYAEQHIVPLNTLEAAVENPLEYIAVGDNPEHVVHIHDGYRVVYSIEQQPIGTVAHLSVSVDNPGKYPHEIAVDLILKEFGMRNICDSLRISIDNYSKSVNILDHYKKEKPKCQS